MESIIEELERIREKPTIVEGINDERSLSSLGFTNVNRLNGPLFEVVESFQEEDEVVILTDLDKEGKKLFGRLSKGFEKRGVKVDKNIRNLLFRTELRQIEGLANYIRRNR